MADLDKPAQLLNAGCPVKLAFDVRLFVRAAAVAEAVGNNKLSVCSCKGKKDSDSKPE